jgi:hypothetical protein
MEFGDGSSLSGTWVDGSLQGIGKYEFDDGTYVEGTFVDSALNGPGRRYTAEGALQFDGHFRNNLKHGRGVWYYDEPHNGRIAGTWSDDELEGEAIYHYPDGSSLCGTWRNGEMQQARFYDVDSDAQVGRLASVIDNNDNDNDSNSDRQLSSRGKRRRQQRQPSTSGGERGFVVAASETGATTKRRRTSPTSSRDGIEATYRHDPSSVTHICAEPFLEDPYERRLVYAKRSEIAGEGLFARRELPAGIIVSFYNGFHLTAKQVRSATIFRSSRATSHTEHARSNTKG